MRDFILLAGAFFGSMGFALLYNIKGLNIFLAALGGGLTTAVYFGAGMFSDNLFLINFLAATFAALYSEIFARIRKTPATLFIAPAIITLVPGGSLYYTLLYALSNKALATEYGRNTIFAACGIAVGIVAVSVAVKTISKPAFPHNK